VLIITPPIWFKAPFKILRLFVREKLRDRVHMLSQSQLRKHLPLSCLPIELGGQLKLEHEKWIDHCLTQIKANAIESTDDSALPSIDSSALSTLRSNSLPAGTLDSQFVFNCELIGESLCSFNTESSDSTDALKEEEDDFRKAHSDLDLAGLSEQLTGLCDKLANNFEQDLGIQSCDALSTAETADGLVCTNGADRSKSPSNQNGSGAPYTNGNGVLNGKSNGTSIVHHALVSEQNSMDSTGTGVGRIGKHKPENIPIRLEQPSTEADVLNGSNGNDGCGNGHFNDCCLSESELEQLLDLQIQFLNDNQVSLHLSSDPGMHLNEFIQYLNGKGRRGLYEEYDSLRKRKNFAFIFDNWTRFREFGLQKKTEAMGTLGAEIDSLLDESIYNSDGNGPEAVFEPEKVSYAVNANHLHLLDLFTYKTSLQKENLSKNRYSDVLCYDHSRVKLDLSGRESPEPFDGFDLIQTDYVNANFVDGFEQKNAFISTQGPHCP
jgi:hypothetical protein